MEATSARRAALDGEDHRDRGAIEIFPVTMKPVPSLLPQ